MKYHKNNECLVNVGRSVFLVIGYTAYEKDTILAAFESKEKADEYCSRCNQHHDTRPQPPHEIEGVDAEWEAYEAAMKAWSESHPASDIYCDSFLVTEVELCEAGK